MDLQDPNSTLLNGYKLSYLRQILPQTFLGGLRMQFSCKLPWFIYIFQVLLWIIPFITGSIFTLIFEFSVSIDKEVLAAIYGVILLLSLTTFNIINVKTQKSREEKIITNNFLTEEDEIEFLSCLSLNTIKFLMPSQSHIFNLIIHPILYGLVCGMAFMFLLPSETEKYFGKTSWCILYYIFGWIVTCIAVFPLIGQQPREPNIFRINNCYNISVLSRGFYVFSITLTSYVLGMQGDFKLVQLVLYIGVLLLPVFWTLGFLPTVDVLFMWSTEQFLVHFLGGSYMGNDSRLTLNITVSMISVVITYFIPSKHGVNIVSSIMGIILSVDICSMAKMCWKKIHQRPTELFQKKGSNRKFTYMEFLILFSALIFSIITSSLVGKYCSCLKTYGYVLDIFGYIVAILIFAAGLIRESLKMFIFFGILSNPLYSNMNKKEPLKSVLQYLSFGLKLFIIPQLLVLIASYVLCANNFECIFLEVLLIGRLYRKTWTDPMASSWDFLVYFIFYWSDFNESYWLSLSTPIQMFLISLGLFWLNALLKKCSFVFLLIFASKKLRNDKKKVNISILISMLCFPFLVLVLCTSVIFSTPLLPLFTLPIFIVGFPRPYCMWPTAVKSSRSSSKDWVYYEQLTPSLLKTLKKEFSPLGLHSLNSGEYYLARFQDRLIWISVLESGFMYYHVVVKGLELQETSCHTTEAESVDEVFNINSSTQHSVINYNVFHIMTPTMILDVQTYSDAKSVLTGVIDNPDFVKTVTKYFPSVLTWVLLRYSKHKKFAPLDNDKLNNPVGSISYSQTSFCCDNTIENIPYTTNTIKTPAESIAVTTITSLPSSTTISGSETIRMNTVSHRQQRNRSRISPSITQCRKTSDSDDEFGALGFSDKEDSSATSEDGDDYSHNDDNANTMLYISGGDSKILDPPLQWLMNLPYKEADLMSVSFTFSNSWYRKVIESICEASHLEMVQRDFKLEYSYKQLVMNCFYLVERAKAMEQGPIHCLNVFNGSLPWSPKLVWLEKNETLKELVVKSYRLAFKLVYDSVVLGVSLDEDGEILESLEEYNEKWFLGTGESDEWFNHVIDGKPFLFSLGQDEKGAFTGRNLSLQQMSVPIARLQEECVRGFWSALSLELYYMTNDDEERYSIQALPHLLRNLITQAADPPLGYPVYTSGMICISGV